MTRKTTLLILCFLLVLIIAVARITKTIVPALKPTFSEVSVEEIEKTIPRDAFIPANGVATFLKSVDNLGVSIFAKDIDSPRVLVLDATGRMLVGTNKGDMVIRISDTDNDGFAETSEQLLKNQDRPHGLLLHDGYLYVAEEELLSRYAYGETLGAQEPLVSLPPGGRHFTRTLATVHDKLYISIGSSCDTCLEDDNRYASVMEVNFDGSEARMYASGLRNATFIKTHPDTGDIFATEMGRDHLGDTLPPDEINIVREGKNYGWPFCYGKKEYDKVFAGVNNCTFSEPAVINLPAHVAPLGFAFIPASWGNEYAGDLLVAYHGSWNSSKPVGYKIERFEKSGDGYLEDGKTFLEGFLDASGGAQGRPVDLIFDDSGILYMSDDKSGIIYAIRQL